MAHKWILYQGQKQSHGCSICGDIILPHLWKTWNYQNKEDFSEAIGLIVSDTHMTETCKDTNSSWTVFILPLPLCIRKGMLERTILLPPCTTTYWLKSQISTNCWRSRSSITFQTFLIPWEPHSSQDKYLMTLSMTDVLLKQFLLSIPLINCKS
jgi:hypothetical protein